MTSTDETAGAAGAMQRFSGEERAMREAIAAWARARWPDVRIIHELVCDECRIDMAFVRANDLIGVEIKSSRDSLDRLDRQIGTFARRIPEVWIAVAPRWEKKLRARRSGEGYRRAGTLIVADGRVREARAAERDELVIMQMLDWLWQSEAARIAQRTEVIPGVTPTRAPLRKIRPMLARLLTGNEIIREVCTELRARPAFGMQSDRPVRGVLGPADRRPALAVRPVGKAVPRPAPDRQFS
jgi:hypothetical protein